MGLLSLRIYTVRGERSCPPPILTRTPNILLLLAVCIDQTQQARSSSEAVLVARTLDRTDTTVWAYDGAISEILETEHRGRCAMVHVFMYLASYV